MSLFNFCVSKTGIKGKGLIRPVYAHSRLGVLSNSLLEEVSFALKTDCLHPLERVSDFVVAAKSEAEEKSVSTESDVVAHIVEYFNRK